MQQDFNFYYWLAECRNYGLTVTKERLIRSLSEFNHKSYQFAMSPDAQMNRPGYRGGQLV